MIRITVEQIGNVERLAGIAHIMGNDARGAHEPRGVAVLNRVDHLIVDLPDAERQQPSALLFFRKLFLNGVVVLLQTLTATLLGLPSHISRSVAPCGSLGLSTLSISAKWLACSGEVMPPRLCGPTFQTMSGTSARGTNGRLLSPCISFLLMSGTWYEIRSRLAFISFARFLFRMTPHALLAMP